MLKTIIVIFYSMPVLPMALALLIVVKAVMFLKHKNARWKLSHFLHFDEDHITESSSVERQTAKRLQNFLTQVIVSMGMITLIFICVNFWFRN